MLYLTQPPSFFLQKLTRCVAVLACLLALVAPASAEETQRPALQGKILSAAAPMAGATIYAYETAGRGVVKVLSDLSGAYAFDELPSGLFKVIALKEGFAPAVEMLLRRRSENQQSLDIELEPLEELAGVDTEDFWAIQGRVPPDVLRDWASLAVGHATAPSTTGQQLQLTDSRFQAQMTAQGGVRDLGSSRGDARLRGAEIGIQGELGSLALDVIGNFQELSHDAAIDSPLLTESPSGASRSIQVRLDGPRERSQFRVTSSSGTVSGMSGRDIARDHHAFQWAGDVSEKGRSGISATYTEEQNFHRQGPTDPVETPRESSTLDVVGFYSHQLTEHTALESGLHYRQVDRLLVPASARQVDGQAFVAEETVGVFSTASSRIQPRVLVEYGLYSQIRAGDMSLIPHGGLLIQLGSKWQAEAAISHRVEEPEAIPISALRSALFGDQDNCRDVGRSCYEVSLSRGSSENGSERSFSIGAVHREYAEPLRMYFSHDLFNHHENLFLVRGDQVPELQLQLVRRVTPRILAKLESSMGAGGGGVFYATDEQAYENSVRYLVTSVDTHFQQTETGVFLAFHHLEQEPTPLDPATELNHELQMQRLQLMLTQDLNILADLTSNWAVQLNMEVSRGGTTPFSLAEDVSTDRDELYKKLTGGFTVSF